MTEKNYTHKIVMFDVNSAKRVAYFESEENVTLGEGSSFFMDDKGVIFIVNNMVQINPVEVIESD